MELQSAQEVEAGVVALASLRKGDQLNLAFMVHCSSPFAVIGFLFAAPCTDSLTSANFGRILAARDNRQAELAIKFIF